MILGEDPATTAGPGTGMEVQASREVGRLGGWSQSLLSH